jgi:hypothetical protein
MATPVEEGLGHGKGEERGDNDKALPCPRWLYWLRRWSHVVT